MKFAGTAVRVAFALGVLGVLFAFVPVGEVAAMLTTLHPWWLVAGLLLQYVMRAVATVRMKIITDAQGMVLDHLTLWRILLATQFYSMVLPGPLVGGGATWLKYVQHGAGRAAAGVAILLNRGIALGVLLVVGSIAWLSDAGVMPLLPAVLLLAVVLLLPTLIALPATSSGETTSGETTSGGKASSYRAAAGSVQRGRIARHARELMRRARLFAMLPAPARLLLVGGSVVHEIVGAGVMLCFAYAVGLELPLLTVLWMRAALQLVLVLPVTIAGLGLREASLVGLCALVDVPATVAIGWSLTIFLGSLVIAATGGLIEAHGLSGRLLRPRRAGLNDVPAARSEVD
jgi:glycosyltransferase 2 family protein